MQSNKTLQELNLKRTSYSNHSTESFKTLIDEVQRKEREQIITKHQFRIERKRKIQQRLTKMKIFNKNDKQHFKSLQIARKNQTQCQISLKIQMCKLEGSNNAFLKHKPNNGDINLPYLDQFSHHAVNNLKKRQMSINKWKIVLNQQQKNMNVTNSMSPRSYSPFSKQKSRQEIKNLCLSVQGLPFQKKCIVVHKNKTAKSHKLSHLKKKFILVEKENLNTSLSAVQKNLQ